MGRRIRDALPSPAIVVAVTALVAALAGTAVAGTDATTSAINKKKVKKIATKQANKAIDAALPVGGDGIADRAVTSGKLADGAVTSGKLAPGAVTDSKITAGALGASKLGDVIIRQAAATVPDGSTGSPRVVCGAGEQALAGGARILANGNDLAQLGDFPIISPAGAVAPATETPNPVGWEGNFRNASGGGGDASAIVYVICLK